ncbi:MAG: UDP-2,3-diacylglucosamine diphosphatase [Syntrophales bacterium]|jgi:UDP-2,3-diacylglucosamine hydrolase|nr:UDP-2,3-diacylglucosamine diphosphatase [Syntrophales bacterium]
MKALFISDAHLKNRKQPAYALILRFLDDVLRGEIALSPGEGTSRSAGGAQRVDRLVVAGDFFDFWFGRGSRICPEFEPAAAKLAELRDAGIRVDLCEGNHDFYLQEYFTDVLGIPVHEEWMDFEFDGLRMRVGHGDTIDRDNRKYLLLRGLLRSRAFYRLQLLFPQAFLWKIASLSSTVSKELTLEREEEIAEKMGAYAMERFAEGCDAVVVGHCHRPVLRQEPVHGRLRTFAALGDWIRHNSYLALADGRFSLMRYEPRGTPQASIDPRSGK